MDMEKSTNNTPSERQLRRTREGRIVAGVCSGAGRYFGVDPNIIRLALAVFTLFGGAGVGVYALAWILIPEEGRPTSIAEDMVRKANDNPKVQDAVNKTVQKTKEAVSKTTGADKNAKDHSHT